MADYLRILEDVDELRKRCFLRLDNPDDYPLIYHTRNEKEEGVPTKETPSK
ncbi:hypothetical protein RFF05_09190 [Bengtsoniella intestinalis]|uniref:hypothetical protein n=1 Tax=Bengtsoniella intestinalis TaxID=3073143 RepID=UPI00391F6590